jgi:acyl-CoA reductase-like NAD-dependent aldehyde dehydrogenase
MIDVEMMIGSADVSATGGATFERLNPVSGEVASRAAAATVRGAIAPADAASEAFPAWSSLGPSARRAKLLRAADLLDARAAEFSRLMVAETGSTAGWGFFNVILPGNMLREVIPSDVPGSLAFAVRQPAGVVLGIAP